jgi:hypothetical protein
MKSIIAAFVFFASLANGRILTCSYGDTAWALVKVIYTCKGRLDSTNLGSIERLEGTHMNNQDNWSVEGLSITEQVILNLPENFADIFPNLKAVDFSYSHIVKFSALNLRNLRNLIFFRIFDNHLKSVESDLFRSNPQLQYVDFGKNALESVGTNLLVNLTSLIAADFIQNKCIDARAQSPEAIVDLNLKLLSNCQLTNHFIEHDSTYFDKK